MINDDVDAHDAVRLWHFIGLAIILYFRLESLCTHTDAQSRYVTIVVVCLCVAETNTVKYV